MSLGEEYLQLLDSYLLEGRNLVQILDSTPWNDIGRINMLKRKLQAETDFLNKVKQNLISNPLGVKKEHITCSNIVNLKKCVEVLISGIEPCSVLKPFNFTNRYGKRCKLNVDIVAKYGELWYKIIARNPKALHLVSIGSCEFGKRSVISQAKDYKACAKQNLVNYREPKLIFVFSSGISQHLAAKLERLGITVEGERIDYEEAEIAPKPDSDSDSDSDSSYSEYTDYEPDIDEGDEKCLLCLNECESIRSALERISFNFDEYAKQLRDDNKRCLCDRALRNRNECINVDITAMVVLVSSLTNGGNRFYFNDKIIDDQAKWEQVKPAKELLEKVMKGKQLLACERAIVGFVDIVSTIGGRGETERARNLLSSLIFMPNKPSEASERLRCTGSISDRGKIIFGTGDRLRVKTLTANAGFLRSASSQGVLFAVIEHEPRVLTEKKEKTAIPISF
ncbi:UPF0415 protein C7orf25 homolog [Artemia franciscana]|uniref:DUF1308 domain-containing protein n=1 Tax=Artemia franciscana TaxID=6661 RepID=A0AA88HZJ0_ARTSF|nr:hypothetical protein QYM36_007313 [Artemia franciscana]KAK2717130.1 hypothetical protein QYM36_007313 [Artemia franciscana]